MLGAATDAEKKDREGERERAQSNLDSFARSKESFSQTVWLLLVIIEGSVLFRHLFRLCIYKGKRRRVVFFLGLGVRACVCSLSVCFVAERGDERRL